MWYARFIHLCLAVALSSLVASIWLIFRIKAGAVDGFQTNAALAVLLGLGVPLATTAAYAFWRRGARGRIYVFHATCAALALALGFATF